MNKLLKTSAALLALLTACAALPAMPAAAAENSKAADAAEYPEWLPTSFTEAVELAHQHGQTYVADGYVCTLTVMNDSPQYSYEEEVSDESRKVGEWDFAFPMPEVLETHEFPDIDSDDEAEMERCNEMNTFLNHFGLDTYSLMDISYSIHVSLYSAKEAGDFTVSLTTSYDADDSPYVVFDDGSWDYTDDLEFTVTPDGTVKETDLFGWMPDCEAEYDAFLAANGKVSVMHGCIVYLGEVCEGACLSTTAKKSGTGDAQCVAEYEVDSLPYTINRIGGAGKIVQLWQPVAAGDLEISWIYGSAMEDAPLEETTVKFQITEGLMYDEYRIKVSGSLLEGDVNGDGKVGVSDIVLLQRYLCGEALPEMKGDFNGDDNINAVDLTLLKQYLLSARNTGLAMN